MEDSRLDMNSLYGGGNSKNKATDSKTNHNKKNYIPKSSKGKKNSFSDTDEHYQLVNDNNDLSESEKWRKQNRILQKQLKDTKKELEEMKRINLELKRKLNL